MSEMHPEKIPELMKLMSIRGIVLLPPKSPRYYFTHENGQAYLMIRLLWRIGYMCFSYALEEPDDRATAALLHDLECNASIRGTNPRSGDVER